MNRIKPNFLCAGDAQHAISICLIIIADCAHLVRGFHVLFDVRVIDPGILRIGDENCCGPFGKRRLHILQGWVALFWINH